MMELVNIVNMDIEMFKVSVYYVVIHLLAIKVISIALMDVLLNLDILEMVIF